MMFPQQGCFISKFQQQQQLYLSLIFYKLNYSSVKLFANFSEQIMLADKYPSIFSRQMQAIVYIVYIV